MVASVVLLIVPLTAIGDIPASFLWYQSQAGSSNREFVEGYKTREITLCSLVNSLKNHPSSEAVFHHHIYTTTGQTNVIPLCSSGLSFYSSQTAKLFGARYLF